MAKSGKQSSVGKGTGRHKSQSAAKGKSTGSMKAVRPAPRAGHEFVPVVCSQCWEELVYDTGSGADAIVCPICEHAAGKPDDATLHHIADKRGQEKRSFMLAFVFGMVAVVSYWAWVFLMANPANAADDGTFYGPLGVAGLCTLLLLIFGAKHEGQRWEVYF